MKLLFSRLLHSLVKYVSTLKKRQSNIFHEHGKYLRDHYDVTSQSPRDCAEKTFPSYKYKLGFDWSKWIDLINSEIIMKMVMIWLFSSDKIMEGTLSLTGWGTYH